MNVLLINVCLRRDSPKKIYPVGLGYVASSIYRAGHNLEILDIDIHRYSDEELIGTLRKKNFDVVAFGCIVTGYKIAKNLCAIIRNINKKAIIIAGNSLATSIPHILLTKTDADIGVMGEGDITIVELLKSLEDGKSLESVSGICFKKDGKIITTKPRPPISNIDLIPLPEWELFEINTYLQESKNYVSEPYPIAKDRIIALPVNTARGCIFKCTFCYHVFRDNKYRYRSPVSIIEEIRTLNKRYGVNYVSFWDELTFFSKKQTGEFVDALIKADIGIFWTASCRAGFLDADSGELARKLKRSGCIGLGYALESTNDKILKSMNKMLNKNDFLIQKRMLDEAGISSWTSLVFGYPEETEETIKETLEFCYKNDIYPSAGFILPQPKTPIYQYLLDKGLIQDEEEYLLSMGDRQDLRINLTQIPSDRFVALVEEYLGRINKKLGLGFGKGSLLKTGHYKANPALPA